MHHKQYQELVSLAQYAARIGVNRSTVWRWLNTDPTFPRPLALGVKCRRWRLADLEKWEASKTEAAA